MERKFSATGIPLEFRFVMRDFDGSMYYQDQYGHVWEKRNDEFTSVSLHTEFNVLQQPR